MKVLIVRYTCERPHDDPEQAAAFLRGAEKIAGLPGLVWKLWTYDDAAGKAANIYLFDSEEKARAWGDGPLQAALGSYPGVSGIEAEYLDVDEQLSEVTSAPLTAQPAAAAP